MNNIVTNFPQILEYARELQIPDRSKRAILREFLQSKIISILYSYPQMSKMSFIGGTSLRLIRDADRFSEDLVFDNLGLSDLEIAHLLQKLTDRLKRENIPVEFVAAVKQNKEYFDLRFTSLLYDLGISSNPKEKLMIKIDHSKLWMGQTPETVLFSKYGFIERVVTNPIQQMLVQKLASYVYRKQTQPRDIFDIVWLYAHGARVDWEFAKANNMRYIVDAALAKYDMEGIPKIMESRLQPFLFAEGSTGKLRLFPDVLNELVSHQ